MRRPVATAVLVLSLGAGCGGGDAAAPVAAPADPALALAQAAERLREARTLEFAASFVETKRAGEHVHTEYMSTEGALDLAAGEGRTVVDMTWLGDELEKLRRPGETTPQSQLLTEPVEVRWDERDAYVRIGDRWQRGPREKLGTGTLGTTSEELANLVALLPHAQGARAVEAEDVKEEPTWRISFTIEARRAGESGVPAELYAAFEQELHGPHLQLEAWLDRQGLPRRLAYMVSKDEVRSQGKVTIPAKSVRVTYTLSAFGDDVDTALPE